MLKRLPNFQDILQVYAVIAVMLSGWTITAFLWKLPAWLLILNLGEILTVFSYVMVTNLIEGLIILLFLILLCMLLPAPLLCKHFVVRGTLLAAGLIASLMAFVKLDMQFGVEQGVRLLMGPLVVWLLTAFLLHFSSRSRFVPRVVSWVSDRLVVFLFVLIPLFVILSVYLIVRTIA